MKKMTNDERIIGLEKKLRALILQEAGDLPASDCVMILSSLMMEIIYNDCDEDVFKSIHRLDGAYTLQRRAFLMYDETMKRRILQE